DTAEETLLRLERRLEELREQSLPLLDPAPAGRHRVVSAMPPEHYEAGVERATELIGRGEFEKIVLAREVQVHAPPPYDPPALLGALRSAFPGCSSFSTRPAPSPFLPPPPHLPL